MAFSKGNAVVTPIGRLCFSYLTSADERGKYRAEIVFPQGTDISALEAASQEVAIAGFGDKEGVSKKIKRGVLTGDRITTEGDPHDDCEGLIRPWTKAREGGKPSLTFHNIKDLRQHLSTDEVNDLFYDGCLVRARVAPFTYDNDGNKGVAWFLNALMFAGDAPRIGGAGDNESSMDAFAAVEGITLEEDSVDSLMPA